ncbi:MurR/RpiR family transcriptional regulator [Asticcacaulis sp. 201]|uniref:MurR/RpiR family transcriptional regulator n=1 Tax=Asticcacaulis sp. 201 TaxID=3028787 RepID=UPI002917013D|nr:MurR/RpiR family transcriptional regulator [Asticcacaulis sp. 201]MDV6331209.1 MurR/RpiR family transcriptional regulator [Asticcacaulis sp. 201]
MTTAPASAEALRSQILESYDGLSKRMKQVARFVLDQPDDLAFETLAVVSQRSGVQPSAVVRFAKNLGFSGANQMQRLIREDLLLNHANLAYGERVRQFKDRSSGAYAGGIDILREHAEADRLALSNLTDTFQAEVFDRFIDGMDAARVVYIVAVRRTFPVAAYLAYSLQQTGKKTVFIDGVGAFQKQAINTIDGDDLLLAISYQSYAEETLGCIQAANERGAPVFTITDSPLSPLAKLAKLSLIVREAEVRNFRSLASAMCLVQSLVIAYAFRLASGGETN